VPVDGIVRNKRTVEAFNCTNGQPREIFMADNSGGIGVMGVIVGALLVIVVGGGILYATGTIGSKSTTVKLELPKVTTDVK
jgi:hypothetical protein